MVGKDWSLAPELSELKMEHSWEHSITEVRMYIYTVAMPHFPTQNLEW